ncbi:MAG: plastocyanin/azurin family copper-binding protein [Acidimicrobiia bacterium]
MVIGRRVRRPIALVMGVVVVGGLVAVGCGGGDDDNSSRYVEPKGPAAATITIKASNFSFDPDKVTADAGVAKLELEDAGGIHTLVFDDGKVPGFQLEVTGDGTDAKKIDLKPGKYTFYCDITGHRAQGMVGTLTVK